MNFGQRLRKLRDEKGDTQKELGKVLNVSESTIGMYERGEREPNFETLIKIANYFMVPVDYLMGLTNEYKKINYSELDEEEREIMGQLREVANEYGVGLTDPAFLKAFEAAIELAKKIRESEDQ
jgi:transcriptional regulator with XRE-family HTH domain